MHPPSVTVFAVVSTVGRKEISCLLGELEAFCTEEA